MFIAFVRARLQRFLAQLTTTDNIHQHTRDDVAVLDGWLNQLIGCCDCGLMHRFDFGLVPSKRADLPGYQLTMTGRRDQIATLAARRERVFPCQPGHPMSIAAISKTLRTMVHMADEDDPRVMYPPGYREYLIGAADLIELAGIPITSR